MDTYPDTFAFVQIHHGDGYVTSWGNGRFTFYGAGGYPSSYFDGVIERAGAAPYTTYRNDYLARRAVPTDVTIDLQVTQISGPEHRAMANVCIEAGGTAKTVRVYMVQVLDHWPASPSYHRNGFKQAASTQDVTLSPGGCQWVSRNFTFDSTSWSNPDDIKIIAWAQEPQSSGGPANRAEVFQAAIMPFPFMADCNENGIPDEDDISAGTSDDCDGNGIPDECQPDCNSNGVADVCDISSATSADCNANGTPDECELAFFDCNGNGTPDDCDIAAATSLDCNGNGTPDECELAAYDCNENSVPDDCDIAAGTSLDCQPNGTPDECEIAIQDCNENAIPDDCDIAGGTSLDCQPNNTPDECEIEGNDCNGNGTPDDCDEDCNTNGLADECDLAAGTSNDCNENGRPDECDVEVCTTNGLWDGFPPGEVEGGPFTFQRPLGGDPDDPEGIPPIDYIPAGGDGSTWANPIVPRTAIIFPFGCETGEVTDYAVQVQVDPGVTDPTEGYVESEFFETDGAGALPPEQLVYSLNFHAKVEEGIDTETDWEYSIHDGTNDTKVSVIRFSSTTSVATGFPGSIVIKDPEGGYIDTGVQLVSGLCYEFEVELDNAASPSTVQVSIDGVPMLTPPRPTLHPSAHRMDYFRVQPVLNGGSGDRATTFRLDHVDLCLTGYGVSPDEIPDCNDNGVLDECDIAQGTSLDANSNGVPDECEPGTCSDGVLNQGEERVDCGGPCPPCNCTSDAACDNGTYCDGTETCDAYGECQPGGGDPCGGGEWCHEAGAGCVSYGDGDFEPNGRVDLADFRAFQTCFGGWGIDACQAGNLTGGGLIELDDYHAFEQVMTGP